MYLKVYTASTEPLKDPETFARLIKLVPESRQKAVMELKKDDNRAASLTAGLLLSLATEWMGLPGADEYIEQNEHGKPYYDLTAYESHGSACPSRVPQVYFNISHSHDRAMCIVSDMEVGCDVEMMRPLTKYTISGAFHPDEKKTYEAIEDEKEKQKFFFRRWTIKESYVKAIGTGYAEVLPKSLCVDEEHYEVSIRECRPCRFYEWDLYDGYRYACCVLARDEEELNGLPDEEPELTEIDIAEEL